MEINQLELLWSDSISQLLNRQIGGEELNVLANQTNDSIRRIEVYKLYKSRANKAVKDKQEFIYTSNPFVLAQREDLSFEERIWIIYLATYFGKSNKSKWTLFERAAFDRNRTLISFHSIISDLDKYFKYLASFDFFGQCQFSNHRKFTAKRLYGDNGFFQSVNFFVDNIKMYLPNEKISFDKMYKLSRNIPNFGRLAGFDFTSSLVKCGFNVEEPKSMYAENSTGPLQGLKLILGMTNSNTSREAQIKLSKELVDWFIENSEIFMVGQVLEDAICNWQKDTRKYTKYSG